MNSSLEWANRAGIILSLLAGFMVAPELIGFARIKRGGAVIDRFLHRVLSRVTDLLNELFPFGPELLFRFTRRPGDELPRDITGFSRLEITLVVVVLFVFQVVMFSLLEVASGGVALVVKEFGRICLFWGFCSVSIVGFFGLYRCLNWLLVRLEDDDRLRALLVALGIAFFIFGNFLQLLATFHVGDKQ